MIHRPTRLVLLGRSLGHSLSPRFQRAALRAAELPIDYELLDIPASALDATLEQLAAESAAGNVTIPYKEEIFARCERLSPIAKRVGAVNTFWFEHGDLIGDNTDVDGFDAAVRLLFGGTPGAITIGIFGAGGAAAGVVGAVERWGGARALIDNRSSERAAALAQRFAPVARAVDAEELLATSDLVVNATSVGMRDDATIVEPARLRAGSAVLDLVYRAGETALVRGARARGLRAMDGLTMLVEQGAHAFERWFGFPPDRDAMWSALR